MTELIADRLRDAKAIAKARVFPYQLMVAYTMAKANANIPNAVCDALQDAMEIAIANVPAIEGRVFVCPDVSGSMSSPATGYRKGATTAVRCIDVAALVAAAVLRKNPRTEVLPFECDVVKVDLNSRDSVMTNAAKLAAIGGGGTNCSAPLVQLNRRKATGDLVIFISDYESWVDADGGRGTATMREWNAFKQRNPNARLACIDVQPYRTVQAVEREDVLNVGGFSDQVFDVISEFARGELNADHWIGVIDSVAL
jgi:60 kDa SS-A/Ro ribonucleoprotein